MARPEQPALAQAGAARRAADGPRRDRPQQGGNAIPHSQQDPRIRREFEETLRNASVASRMEERFYRPSSDAKDEPPQLM
jgi:hypothetical protein